MKGTELDMPHDTIIKFMCYEKVNFRVVIGGRNGCHGKL